MASFIAKHTVDLIAKKAKNTLQKHTDDIIGNNDNSNDITKTGGIDWTQHNYPRFIHICHYDITVDPVPLLCKKIVRHVYNTAHMIQFMLVVNVIMNIALVGSHIDTSADHILFSFLHLIIGTALVQYTWFIGYKGLCTEIIRYKYIFYSLFTICIIIMILYISIASGNVHGYSGINNSNVGGYNIVCGLESTMWLITILISIYVLYKYTQYNGHTINFRKDQHNVTLSKVSIEQQQSEPEVKINPYSIEAEYAKSGRTVSKKHKDRYASGSGSGSGSSKHNKNDG